ncbi:unnamed protein product [Phytophthora fragariaefolia]|uniref:Unnamed protein product n=1 Tax=Phytophthora fragariaefolia TaxID=1490495 RepID=A0A9W6YCU6_9STRA|nr:unnamed protein product [Phytophthora fragariaefolia]
MSDARASAPEPMEIDAIEAKSRSRSTSTARGPRFNNDTRPRDGRPLICYRCRKSGHRAAVCREPAPVLASAEVIGEADDMFPTANICEAASCQPSVLSQPFIEDVAGLHIQATSTLVQHALMDTFRWATCSVVTIHSRKHYYWQKATDICQ